MAAKSGQDGEKHSLFKMTSKEDEMGIISEEVPPDGSITNPEAAEPGGATVAETSLGKPNGMNVAKTTVFIVGEMAGSGVLALPRAIVNAGWIGLVMLVTCCIVSGFNGVQLGRCWTILQERWPEYRQHTRAPYPAIAERAVGKPMRYVVSVCIDMTLFGVATVFLLLAAQNVQSMLSQAGVHVSFCYWLLVMTAALIPAAWLGTPKDFWPIAVGATFATALACLLAVVNIGLDSRHTPAPKHSSPSFENFFLSFGAILFSFGGASTFPTVQHDMKEPTKFSWVVTIGYSIILSMYLPVSAAGFLVYGDGVKSNILQSMSGGGLRITVEFLITAHLLLAFVIALNPVAQEFESIFKVRNGFHWSRCLLRTVMVLCILFVAESIPHFGAILDLVGGSTVTFLTFVFPSIFYLRLAAMTGDWPDRRLPLHSKVANIEIILVGIIGGVASTYAAIFEITSPSTFIPPCYVNISAASKT